MNKRLLIINDFLQGGGAEIVAQHHTEIFRSKGWHVRFMLGARSIKNYNNKYIAALLNVYGYTIAPIIRLIILLAYKPTVIHVYNWYHLITPSIFITLWLYKKMAPQTKLFYSAHDHHFITTTYPKQRTNLKYKLFRHYPALLFYKTLKLPCIFDMIFAPSETLSKDLEKYFSKLGCPKKVELLYNPMPDEYLQQLKKYRRNWAHVTKINRLRLIFVGRVSKEKSILEFCQLLNNTINKCKDIPKVSFTIVGDGKQLPIIKKEQNQFNFELNTLGRRPLFDIPKLMQGHHALILYSKKENAPLVMREAALTNIFMLVAHDHAGIDEYGQKLKGTIFFAKENKKSLCSALKELAKLVKKGKPPRSLKELKNIQQLFDKNSFYSTLIKYYT